VTSLRIAWRLLQARGAKNLLTVAILALGIGLMTAATAVRDATRGAVSAMSLRYPLVVGPPVGAVPLVLGSLTRLQDLEAGISGRLLQELEGDERLDVVVPLLAGHAVQGFPLLGTSAGYLQPRERFPLADGRVFELRAMEVVLGSEAALGLGAGVGERLEIEHQHQGAPSDPGRLLVTGVLAPTQTDADLSLFCPVHAIHHSHGLHQEAHAHDHANDPDHDHAAANNHDHDHDHDHDHENTKAEAEQAASLSALLLRPRDAAALLSLQEELTARPGLEVALTGQTLRRLGEQLAGGGKLLGMVVTGVVLITFLSLLMSIYSTVLAQSRQLAMMRVLGARRWQVVGITLTVVLGICAAGLVCGLGVAALLASYAEAVLRMQLGLEVSVNLLSQSSAAYLGLAMAMLLLVGVQPALAAYHLQAAVGAASLSGSGASTRSYLRWGMRFLVPLAIFLWAEQMMSRHGAEAISAPLEPASAALYRDCHMWSGSGEPPPELAARDGKQLDLEGYMYALGDPFEVQDFHLVALNPRLPRCPFCYRAPTRRERVLVVTGGRSLDVSPGPVRVSGIFSLREDSSDPYVLHMEHFEVIVER